ncbi:phosphoethanolamine transferase class O [Peziza echinospora]|nr:phosphoethanolamine transferase class O [Peziza echinospora]
MEESPLVGLAAEFKKAKERLREEQRQSKENIKLANKRDEVQFKAIHGLLVVFFVWILALHASGIYLFTRGFLLTRLVLEEQSVCNVSPISVTDSLTPPAPIQGKGCWHPKKFDKAVIVVIDALRFDFTVPFAPHNTPEGSGPHQFHDALTVLSEVANAEPNNAILFPFIADPPTTTLQRLQGLTTGTLPTFIDAGSNFAGTAIDEDNLISQLRSQGKKIAFLGDDTWMALFGRHFEANLTHPYDSLNVWDLHTVDNGVNEHIFPLLQPDQSQNWDVLIGHYLGVDHAGHRYGPDHPAMNTKLKQMDQVIRDLIQAVDDDTLLVIMGDHGMDPKGDHGGESQLEVEAALWMYSRKGIFGRSEGLSNTKDPRPVAQIDFVPTLALLLGLPIPFNNLGAPIPEAFLGPTGDDWENLAEVTHITNAQIKRYQKEYATIRKTDVAADSLSTTYWTIGESKYRRLKEKATGSQSLQEWEALYKSLAAYQRENLRVCKDLWARFDVGSMFAGIVVLIGSIAAIAVFARGIRGDKVEIIGVLLQRIATGMSVGVGIAFSSGFVFSIGLSRANTTILGATLGSLVGFGSATFFIRRRLVSILPSSPWGVLAVVFTAGHAILFASNSFVIWEDKVLNYLLATFGVASLINSQRQSNLTQRALGTYHSIVFLVLTRVASLSQLCREEQMPFCKSTFYASATSSVSSPYSLVLLFFMAAALPAIIKSFYMGTKSYEGLAGFWIGFSFRLGLVFNALYWTLDSADNGEWLSMDEKLLKAVKMLVAQLVLALGFIAGHVGFAWVQICLGIEVKQKNEVKPQKASDAAGEKVVTQSGETVALLGYSNLHGSRFLLLVVSWSLCLILVQKPLGGVSIGILLWQILNVLEILDCNDISSSAIGPVVLGILGNSHFFSTGHQATLASIQWESAFIPFSTIVYPWSPMLIALNSVGPQILTAVAVPLIGLWKRDPKSPGMLSSVVVSAATFVIYHAVIATSAAACAGWLRRHLMLHKIFSPRFMLGGVVLLVVDAVVAFVGLGALRWNVPAVAEVFGYLY